MRPIGSKSFISTACDSMRRKTFTTASEEHILAAIARQVRASAGGRATLLVAENEPQDTRLVRPASQGGFGIDALWNDDFHHSAQVVLSGRSEAYYSDYRGTPQEFISAAKYGYLYQGQWYKWQKRRRGTPGLDLPPAAFVNYIQNHDQVANSIRGERCHAIEQSRLLSGHDGPLAPCAGDADAVPGPGIRLLAAVPLLCRPGPGARLADSRRPREVPGPVPQPRRAAVQACLPDPADPRHLPAVQARFFRTCCRTARIYALHRDLLRLRREDRVFSQPRRGGLDGAVLGPAAFVLRYFGKADDDRLLIVNFGADLHLDPAPEPLLAPPEGCCWQLLWSSEDPAYGGSGTPPLETEANWTDSGMYRPGADPRVGR